MDEVIDMDTKVYWPMVETIAWYENGLSIGESIEYTLSEEDRVAGASLAFVLTLMDDNSSTGTYAIMTAFLPFCDQTSDMNDYVGAATGYGTNLIPLRLQVDKGTGAISCSSRDSERWAQKIKSIAVIRFQ